MHGEFYNEDDLPAPTPDARPVIVFLNGEAIRNPDELPEPEFDAEEWWELNVRESPILRDPEGRRALAEQRMQARRTHDPVTAALDRFHVPSDALPVEPLRHAHDGFSIPRVDPTERTTVRFGLKGALRRTTRVVLRSYDSFVSI